MMMFFLFVGTLEMGFLGLFVFFILARIGRKGPNFVLEHYDLLRVTKPPFEAMLAKTVAFALAGEPTPLPRLPATSTIRDM